MRGTGTTSPAFVEAVQQKLPFGIKGSKKLNETSSLTLSPQHITIEEQHRARFNHSDLKVMPTARPPLLAAGSSTQFESAHSIAVQPVVRSGRML